MIILITEKNKTPFRVMDVILNEHGLDNNRPRAYRISYRLCISSITCEGNIPIVYLEFIM